MKHTLTIAIPAYNEEKSLPQLLNSIKEARISKPFILQSIILASDCSLDKTNEIIQKFNYKKVKVQKIFNKSRKGKVYLLNYFYAHTNTDYLIVLDADIKIDKFSIENLLLSANKNKSVLTVSHQIPIRPKNFIGKIIYRGYLMWSDIRTSNSRYHDNSVNFYGAASAYSRIFYRSLRIPQDLHDERKFIYYSAKKIGKFVYEMSSIIYFHPVSTFRDLYMAGSRGDRVDAKIIQIFGNDIDNAKSIPLSFKIGKLAKHFLINPLQTIGYMFLKYLIMFTRKIDPLIEKGMWSITTSTKKGYEAV